jgi:propane monooxygenase reductase subunit
MVEAAIPMLEGLGVVTKHIYYDKFTTTGDAGDSKVLEAESR